MIPIEKTLKYVSVFALVCVVSGYVAFKILSSGLPVEVPAVTDRTVPEAREALEKLGLTLFVQSEEHDRSVPEGRIISQDIPAGSSVRGKAEVSVVVSKGPQVRQIPSVIGLGLDAAKKTLLKENLQLEKSIFVHSDTVEKGKIIAQRPAPDEWTGEGITLIASAGPYDIIYYCPFFLGMYKDDALLLAAELGLNAELREAVSGARFVSEQNPEPGGQIKQGDTLYLILGEGDQ